MHIDDEVAIEDAFTCNGVRSNFDSTNNYVIVIFPAKV